jgi:hypothetical protein
VLAFLPEKRQLIMAAPKWLKDIIVCDSNWLSIK